VAGQVALVLAAAGSGGRTVGVGVLPLLEELLGLVEENLARRRRVSGLFSRMQLYRSGSIWVMQLKKVCGGRGRRVVVQ
jgi:hypothetical protein